MGNIEKTFFCPICHEKVTGNEKIKYFCKKCNVLFSEHSLLNKKEIDSKKDDVENLEDNTSEKISNDSEEE